MNSTTKNKNKIKTNKKTTMTTNNKTKIIFKK